MIGDSLDLKDSSKEDDCTWNSDVEMVDAHAPKKKKKKSAPREEGRAFHGTLLGGGGGFTRTEPEKEDPTVPDSIPPENSPVPETIATLPSAVKTTLVDPEPLDSSMKEPSAFVDDDLLDGPTCLTCTFINPSGVSSCTVCDSPF